MREFVQVGPWVVYCLTDRNAPGNLVCQRQEWDEIQVRRPGVYELVEGEIATEADADRIARGTSGDKFNVASVP